ncbi:unnamed protein product [marine sediment metagenome]|uniref:CARDB domain-containing protein n=1 Tax=marine sediment metagenome TaxID=412755 RepID=X1RZ62_9ZZZZ
MNNIDLPELELEDWMPMKPAKGPPLPRLLEIYWPWYTPPGAEFKVSNLVISPTEVNPGQPVTISCTVTNIGAAAGSSSVHLGGDFMAEKMVYLEPGQSTVVSFEVTPAEAKTFHVSVNGLTGSFVATEVPVADIRVENLVIEPAEVNVGEKVTISVMATNYGTKVGSKTIVCTVT